MMTTLTPNRRLAATLHQRYQLSQQEKQLTCWDTPDILPASSFIQKLFTNYSNRSFSSTPFLLQPTQEIFLWEKIIADSAISAQLLHVSETAQLAQSAWSLLKAWRLDLHHPLFSQTDDCFAWQQWALAFQTLCQEKNQIDSPSLLDWVTDKILSQAITLPTHIRLIGFTEITPQWQHFLDCAQQSGCDIENIPHVVKHHDNHLQRVGLLDSEDEIFSMARFAKKMWNHHRETTIGCVIPALDKNRDRVLQIFSQVFAESDSLAIDPVSSPFNLSAGKPLLHYPVIEAAWQILSLHKKKITAATFRYLLASPFLGEAEKERIQRARWDARLRQENVATIDLTTLAITKQCPALARRLQKFLLCVDENNQKQPYHFWAEFITQLLKTMAWPGERSINSEEYQVVERFLNLLLEFSNLDHISAPVYLSQALQTLHTMASHTVFQYQTPQAPIQILGVLEAAAIPFDYLWVAGMDDISWPPQPQPHPFLPKRLQREYHMPHATAQRELRFCESLLAQFKVCAPQVIFSHSQKNEECTLQVSPLIRHLPETTLACLDLDAYHPPSFTIYQAKINESILDNKAPSLTPNEKISGGTQIIKQQALCPFKAFATCRLHASELEKPSPGLRAKERGNLVHGILELIWKQLGKQKNLLEVNDETLHEIIATHIETALHALPSSQLAQIQLMNLEKKRLQQLIYDWLQLEKQRPDFTVIQHEASLALTLGPLNLSIRVDRIDELENGKKLILDYKTGKHNEIANFFGERPEEPQLPLYALHHPEETIGIAYAQLAKGGQGFKGVSQHDLAIPGIKPVSDIPSHSASSWEAQVSEWQTRLTQLAHDFYQGVATVNPKNLKQTCLHCDLKPVCRFS